MCIFLRLILYIYYTCMHIYMYILYLCIPKYTSIFVQPVCYLFINDLRTDNFLFDNQLWSSFLEDISFPTLSIPQLFILFPLLYLLVLSLLRSCLNSHADGIS